MRAGGVGLGRLRLPELQRPVDECPLVQVIPVDERHGDTGAPRAAGPAGPVQVGLLVIRDRVVDHVCHVIDVDTAGCDIRGDEYILLARLERGHRALACFLAHVAVHGYGGEAAVLQFVDELLGRALGAREDDGLAPALGLQDAGDDLIFIERVRAVDEVTDVGLREPLIGVGCPDVDRVAHEPARQGHDLTGHRGREQLRVADSGNTLEDLFDVGEEPEVQHLVGLVEDDLGRVREVEQALPGEVDESPGGADDDLCAGLQLLDLALVCLAAIDRDDRGRPVLGQHVHVFIDLDGQLTRGNHDERLHARLGAQAEPLHDGDAEAKGLAGTGLCLADDVLAGKAQRNGLLLDGERVDNSAIGERIDDVLIHAEIGESRHNRSLSGSPAAAGVGSTPFTQPQARGPGPMPETFVVYRRALKGPSERVCSAGRPALGLGCVRGRLEVLA